MNSLVEKELTKSYFVDKTVFNQLTNSYYNFLIALKNYEAKKITKAELRKKAKPFLNSYTEYQKEFNKVIEVKKDYIKWIEVKNYVFKNFKLQKVLTLLDKLVKKELLKAKYTKDSIKKFYDSYNMFKLAVKYMKSINKVEGKKYARQYAKQMLEILK